MSSLNPWQLLVWIAGLELISIPLIIFMVNAIVIGYFKTKEQHQIKFINAIGGLFEKIGSDLMSKNSKEGNNEH